MFTARYGLGLEIELSALRIYRVNTQQLYALPTLYLCVLYLSQNKQRLVPLTADTGWFL